MPTTLLRIGVGALLLAGTVLAQTTETPLARLEIGGEKAGWDGIALGMSAVQVERRTGVTLALEMNPGSRAAATCQSYAVMVERGTLRLTLGFPSAKPGAKLESIYVQFEGYQVTAKQEALVAELKAKIPGAVYLPPQGTAPPAEANDPAPVYLIPGGKYAARLVPGDGLRLTLRDCVG